MDGIGLRPPPCTGGFFFGNKPRYMGKGGEILDTSY
jgi:hypothetical protein